MFDAFEKLKGLSKEDIKKIIRDAIKSGNAENISVVAQDTDGKVIGYTNLKEVVEKVGIDKALETMDKAIERIHTFSNDANSIMEKIKNGEELSEEEIAKIKEINNEFDNFNEFMNKNKTCEIFELMKNSILAIFECYEFGNIYEELAIGMSTLMAMVSIDSGYGIKDSSSIQIANKIVNEINEKIGNSLSETYNKKEILLGTFAYAINVMKDLSKEETDFANLLEGFGITPEDFEECKNEIFEE